jgi:hypothetical protein
MSASNAERVRKHRAALREAGLRPIQIWVPDTRRPGFLAECDRQARMIAEADRKDPKVIAMLDAALDDIEGWEA